MNLGTRCADPCLSGFCITFPGLGANAARESFQASGVVLSKLLRECPGIQRWMKPADAARAISHLAEAVPGQGRSGGRRQCERPLFSDRGLLREASGPSAGSYDMGNIACLRRTTSLSPLKQNPIRVYPWLKLVAFRGAGS